MSEREWSQKQKDAQVLLAIGSLEKQDIVKSIGIHRSTLWEWEKLDGWKAEVDRYRHNKENFAITLYYNSLIDAVNNLRDLGANSSNDMVRLNANLEIVNRILGKTTSKHEITTKVDELKNVNDDILEAEFEQFESDIDEE